MTPPPVSGKLIRYAVVGTLTLVVYLAVGEVAHRNGLAMGWQASLAFIAAVAFNYLLQQWWVFEGAGPTASTFPKYVVMVCVGYLINLTALKSLTAHLPLLLAQLIAVTLVVLSNAGLAFTWVFLNQKAGRKRGAPCTAAEENATRHG